MKIPKLNTNLEKNCPWAEAMKASQQDPTYHAEADVWTHTLMVLGALKQLQSYKALPPNEQTLLEWAALLHDNAKPETQIFEEGRLQNPRHGLKGAFKARALLWQLGADLEAQSAIFNLIRFHGLPPHLLEKRTEHLIPRISQAIRLDWLSTLAHADMIGRICADPKEQEEKQQTCLLLADLAKEMGCLSQPFQFSNAFSRITFCEDPNAYLPWDRFDPAKSTMHMLMGIPGSGKTTYREKLKLPTVSLDDIRRRLKIKPEDDQGFVVQTAKEEAKTYLRRGENFIFDATNLTKLHRDTWVSLAREYKSAVEIHWISASYKETQARNNARPDSTKVPHYRMEEMALELMPPQLEDVWNIHYVENSLEIQKKPRNNKGHGLHIQTPNP
jgi:predicted kinase